MPLRTSSVVEKQCYSIPTVPITVAANTSTPILPDVHADKLEYASRKIQNCDTVNFLYYGFGANKVDTTNFQGILLAGQQLDCSNHGDVVNVWSANQIVVASTIIARQDLTQGGGILNQPRV